jgi:predicted amidohydrolase YtcJ
MVNHILTNCRIYTFNPLQPIAQALAIQAGKITAVGSHADIIALAGKNTIVEDLQGSVILPALTDAHIHLLEYGLSLQRIDCETDTRAECLQRIRERVDQSHNDQWVLGHGWNHNTWPEGIGNKEMLDAISPEQPIYLTHKSLHSAWANTAALKRAGINEDSPNPAGGQFLRDQDGRLTGILLEGAMRVLEDAIPRPDQTARMNALLNAQQSMLKFGITSVHDFDPWDCYTALSVLEENHQLILRVMKGIPQPNLDEVIQSGLRSGSGSQHLALSWLKLFADGALGPQTAAMLAPYEQSDSSGMLFLESEDIVDIGQKALRHGISLAVHAIGDRANREVINGYAQLSEMTLLQKASLPVRIEHVQLIASQDIARLASLGITASMQPIHAISDRKMADKHWGDRCRNAYAWQSVKTGGAKLVFGSDAPVESPNPFWGIFAAVTRKPLHPQEKVESWQPHQCLSIADALSAYITQPQEISGNSSHLGKLQKGYLADLVQFHTDPFKADRAISQVLPVATMVDGEWVYSIS